MVSSYDTGYGNGNGYAQGNGYANGNGYGNGYGNGAGYAGLATLPVATLTIATVTVATDKDPTDKPGTMAALTDLRWLTMMDTATKVTKTEMAMAETIIRLVTAMIMMLTAPTTTDVLTRVTKSKLFQTTTEHDMVDAIIYDSVTW